MELKTLLKKLNRAFNDGKMQEHEKIALITTYDNAIIKRENFQEVIEAFRKFEAETSLKEQSDVIEEALKDEKLHRYRLESNFCQWR